MKYFIFFISTTILILVDQLTKQAAVSNLKDKVPFKIIDGVLEFVYTENQGAAFGILQGKQIFFYVLTIIVFAVLIYLLVKLQFDKHNICYFITLILIFAGAFGNFIDRILNKYVVDFIYFMPIDFPVFNFADICITCGCILLIISTLTIYRKD